MNVLELRQKIVERVAIVENEAFLEGLERLLIEELEKEGLLSDETNEEDENDDYDGELTEEQWAAIQKARIEVRKPENQMSHDEAMRRLKIGIYGTDLVSAGR